MFTFFKSKKIKELETEFNSLQNQIYDLKNNIRKKDGFLKCKNKIFTSREKSLKDNDASEKYNWQEIEENLKKLYNENQILKKNLKHIECLFPLTQIKHSYLIPIQKYFVEIRYKNIVSKWLEKDIKYIQQLNETKIDELDVKKYIKDELKIKYLNFLDYKIKWDIKTYLIKGEKLSILYKHQRKFLNILSKKNIEYVGDLDGFDFQMLKDNNFSNTEINSIKTIYLNYISANRVH